MSGVTPGDWEPGVGMPGGLMPGLPLICRVNTEGGNCARVSAVIEGHSLWRLKRGERHP